MVEATHREVIGRTAQLAHACFPTEQEASVLLIFLTICLTFFAGFYENLDKN